MNKLDNYINSLYKDLGNEDDDLEELKLDMKNNMIEAINELKEEGYSESESIDIVIDRIGERNILKSEISQLFNVKKFNIRSLSFIFLSFIFFIFIMNIFKQRGIFFL